VTGQASPETVAETLRKAMPEAKLSRIPRHPERRDIVLAILCLEMRRRYPYAETEINEYLARALAALRASVDHVTCRRYMVDLGFMKRDRAGTRYFLNYPKVEATLSAEAIDAANNLVEDALAFRRKPSRRPGASKRPDTKPNAN
jgi:hypothetical protein